MTKRTLVSNLLAPVSGVLVIAAGLYGCVVHDADLDSAAIVSFDATPATDETGVYSVVLSVTADLAYASSKPADLEVLVGGQVVHAQTFDVSSETNISETVTVPLLGEGPNEVVATLSYNGQVETLRNTVTVNEEAATVAFPAWSTSHNQSQTITVTPAEGWTATRLQFAINGGTWIDATVGDAGAFTVDLQRLDIGDNEIAVRATTESGVIKRVDNIVDTIPDIAPVFDCAMPAESMLPSTELVRELQDDTKTMVGYFGDPQRDHDILFVLRYEYDAENQDITAGAVVTSRSWDSVQVAFNTRAADCNRIGNNCTQDYKLSLYVDGKLICENDTFGRIRDL